MVGPDLTYANRKDRDFLLVSLVDPSGVVRKEYQASLVATGDGICSHAAPGSRARSTGAHANVA